MALTLITPPAQEPITLAEAKAHLRITEPDQDDLIAAHLQAAREQAEQITGRAFMPQAWRVTLDAFPAGAIELPRPPLAAVTSIKYIDPAGVQQTITPADYMLDTATEPGWVLPVAGKQWPATQDRINAVEVVYTVGWPDAAAVPGAIKAWIKLRLQCLFDGTDWPAHADSLLDRWRLWRV